MDVFKFIDDTVRGAIRFVYDFLRSTATLAVHPVRGPYRLMARYRRGDVQQISPITYFALALVVVSLAPAIANERDRGSEMGRGLARFFATGSLSSDVVPILIGVIVGTIVFDALLRILSQRLSAARRERFVGIMEYGFGAFTLILAPLANAANSLVGEEAAPVIVAAPYGFALVFLTIHFYALLLRRPAHHKWLRRASRVPREIRRDGLMPSLARAARWTLSFRALGWALSASFMTMVWIFASVVPLLILLSGWFASTETARWLSERPGRTPVLTVAGLRCGLDGDPAMARAILWNGSDLPALNWSGAISVRPLGPGGKRGSASRWHARLPDNRRGDLVLPGDSVELAGRISGLEQKSLPADAARGWPCVLESGGNVRLGGI